MYLKLQFTKVLFIFILINVFHSKVFCQDELDQEANIKPIPVKTDSLEPMYYMHSKYFLLNNMLDTLDYGDTILTDRFPYFNPIQSEKENYIDKGNIGSGAFNIKGYRFQPGFDLGIHSYDLYNYTLEHLKWQFSKLPFSQLSAIPSSTITNFWVNAKFVRNFKDINLMIDYNRLIDQGKYNLQNTKHSALNFGFWVGKPQSRFNTFFNILINSDFENNNGGIKTEADLYLSDLSLRKSVLVNLSDSETRLINYTYSLTEIYRLSDKFKFLWSTPYLSASAGYKNGFYKFFDASKLGDSSYFGDWYSDPAGLRNYIDYKTYWTEIGYYSHSSNNSFINLSTGYQYNGYEIESQSPATKNFLNIKSNGRLIILKKFNFNFKIEGFLESNKSEYKAESGIELNTKYFNASFSLNSSSVSTPVLMQKLVLTNKVIYDNNFPNTKINGINAKLIIPKYGFTGNYEFSLIDNYIYFNSSKYPELSDNTITYQCLNLEEKLHFWVLNFDNNISLYKSSSDHLSVPKYILRSKFYFNSNIFSKLMQLQTGFEYNYWDQYYNYEFNPAIANFYVQNQYKLPNFQRLDFFVNSKVGDVMFFIRFNNILFPIDKKVYFKSSIYPQEDLFYRFGIKWTLYN